ncbi:PEP-CTERM sorting domain-containing protein [Thalassotalea piscium]
MSLKKTCNTLLALVTLSFSINATANIINFDTFKIRNNNGTTTSPYDADIVITENAAGDGFYAETPLGGQKVGYGTNAFDGMQINQFTTVNWTTNTSATGAHPYLNMWVTDGSNYAVIASENAYMGTNFQTRQEWKIYEFGPTGNFDWLFDSGTGSRTAGYLQRNGIKVTLADFSNNITLYSGPVGTTSGVGAGAPRGGYGFNVLFGDTQSNFIGSYFIENLTVAVGQTDYEAGNLTTVPEPTTLAIFALGLMGLSIRRIKK